MENMEQELDDIEDGLIIQGFNLEVTETSNLEDNSSILTLTNTEHASIEKHIHMRQKSIDLIN